MPTIQLQILSDEKTCLLGSSRAGCIYFQAVLDRGRLRNMRCNLFDANLDELDGQNARRCPKCLYGDKGRVAESVKFRKIHVEVVCGGQSCMTDAGTMCWRATGLGGFTHCGVFGSYLRVDKATGAIQRCPACVTSEVTVDGQKKIES